MPKLTLPAAALLSLALTGCGDKDTDDGTDADQDGFTDDIDCNDLDPDINPGATETCDGDDNDCDGLVDDADDDVDLGDGSVYFPDVDFDGYGDAQGAITACQQPAGYVADDSDCDDNDDSRNPAAADVCDEIDNDCDDEVDEDGGGGTWYTDADSDGYGDDSSAVTACEQPDDTIEVGGDCNDDDGSVFPGAEELCDGADNDCDDVVDGDGLVALQARDGTWSSLTDAFTSTSAAPASPSLDQAGDVWVCDGTYYVNVDIDADVSLMGRSGSSDNVTLNGAGLGSVVHVLGDGLEVTLEDLTLTNGSGDATDYYGTAYGGGGGIACEASDSIITGAGLVIEDNVAGVGGGVHLYGCDLTLTDTVIDNNYASLLGGGLLSAGGQVLLSGVDVLDNSSINIGGGIYSTYASASPMLEMTDVVVDGNDDYYGAGGIYAYYTNLSMSGASAITSNSSRYGYGNYLYPGSSSVTTSFSTVDFGSESGGDNNSTYDLFHDYYDRPYHITDDATFTCSSTTCGSSRTYTVGSTTSQLSVSGSAYGNWFEADEYATIDYFSAYVGYYGACQADLYVLSTESEPTSGTTSTWAVEWSDTGNTVSGTGWITGSGVNVLAEPGMNYGFLVGMRCTSNSDYIYYSSDASTSVGWGTDKGYVNISSYSATLGSTASVLGYETSVAFYMYVGSTQL